MDTADPRIDPQFLPAGTVARVYAEDQPEYQPLPVVRTPAGTVISRWQPTPEERQRIAAGEDLYLMISTFNQPLQPVGLTVGVADWRGY